MTNRRLKSLLLAVVASAAVHGAAAQAPGFPFGAPPGAAPGMVPGMGNPMAMMTNPMAMAPMMMVPAEEKISGFFST